MRINVNNTRLPGVQCERVTPLPGEERREAIYDRDGEYVGAAAYVRVRHRQGGSTYGWRVAGTRGRLLFDLTEAVERMLATTGRMA